MADDADIWEHQKRLLDQLAASPVVEVLGVVAPSGVSGSWARGDELWTLSLTFDAWRVAGAELQTGPRRISQKMPEQEIGSWQRMITPYSVIRIKARVGLSAFGDHLDHGVSRWLV